MESTQNIKDNIITPIGEDNIVKDNNSTDDYANYMAYIKLRSIGYSTEQALDHMSISINDVERYIEMFDPGIE